MSRKIKVSGLILASVIAGSTVMNPLASAEHITPKHTAEGTITYNEEFDTLDTEKWDVIRHNIENSTSGIESKDNVSVENGNLVIKTHRHCVTDDEVPNKDNISEKPCGIGKTTRYTTGRIENTTSLDGNTSYRVDIRAKVESNGTTGTQPALWLQRNNTSYCQKKDWDSLGEIDIFESFKGDERRTHSGAILSCDGEGPEGKERKTFTKGTQAELYEDGVLNEWHTWSVIYDKQNETFEFLLDEKPVPISKFWYTRNKKVDSSSTGSKIDINKDYGLTEEQKREILDHTYRIILNDSVKINDSNLLKNNEDFPEQRFLVDSVVVRQYDKSPYEKDKTAENPSVTPTDKPKEDPSATPTDKPKENPSATPTNKPADGSSEPPTNKPEEDPSVTPTGKPSDSSSEPPTNTPENGNNVDNPASTQPSVSDTVQTPVNTPINTSETSAPKDSQNPSTSVNIPSDNDNTEDVDDRKDYDPIVSEKKESTEKTSSNEPFVKKDQSQTPVQNKVASPSIQPQQLSPAPVVAPPAPVQPVYAPKVGPTVDTGGSVHVSWWKNFYNKLVG